MAQVGPKISSGRLLEALLKGPGGVQGGSWGALGAKRPSWRPQRCQNGFKGPQKGSKFAQDGVNMATKWLKIASTLFKLAHDLPRSGT